MYLWLISQDAKDGYDTYDSAVVAAPTEEGAQRISPSPYYVAADDGRWHFAYADGRLGEASARSDWCDWHLVKVECIGEASAGTAAGLILASFNAG